MRLLWPAMLLVAGACTRDFPLPAQPPPAAHEPKLVQVAPDAAFTGDRLVIEGTDLGTAATSVVRIGGRTAEQVPGPSGALAALMPDDLPPGPLDVSVTTDAGEAQLEGVVRWLGPGHPRTLAVRADLYLGATPVFTWASENVGFVIDRGHYAQIPVDPLVGDPLGPPVRAGVSPVLSYGSETVQWVYSLGASGAHPELMRFSYADGQGRRTCDADDLTTEDDPLKPNEMYRAAASDDALLLAAPIGGHKLMLVRGDDCPPVPKIVDVGDTVVAVVVSGDEVIVVLSDRFLRITASGELLRGSPPVDPDEVPAADGIVALDPSSRRLAYRRVDGDVGFVAWDERGGPPVVEEGALFMYRSIRALGFSSSPLPSSGKPRFYVGDIERLTVFDEPSPDAQIVASASLDVVQHIASLPDGEVLVSTMTGTALLTRDGTLLRTGGLSAELGELYPDGVTADGRVTVRSAFGPQSVTPDLQYVRVTYTKGGGALVLSGVSGSNESVVAWQRSQLYGYVPETGLWKDEQAFDPSHEIIQAARSPDGRRVAAGTWEESTSTYRLELAGPEDLRSIDLPDTLRARVLFADGALLLVQQLTNGFTVKRLDPATLEPLGAPVVLDPGAEFQHPELRMPAWSHALNALVVPVSETRVRADGSREMLSGHLFAVRGDHTVLRTPVPLPAMLASMIGLSPDGRLFVSAGADPLIDAGLIEEDGDGLRVRYAGHQELDGRPAPNAAFSADGASLYLVLPNAETLVLVQ